MFILPATWRSAGDENREGKREENKGSKRGGDGGGCERDYRKTKKIEIMAFSLFKYIYIYIYIFQQWDNNFQANGSVSLHIVTFTLTTFLCPTKLID